MIMKIKMRQLETRYLRDSFAELIGKQFSQFRQRVRAWRRILIAMNVYLHVYLQLNLANHAPLAARLSIVMHRLRATIASRFARISIMSAKWSNQSARHVRDVREKLIRQIG